MDRPLSGKHIFYLGISFYDYNNAIRTELEKLGATVDLFVEENQGLLSRFIRKYLQGLRFFRIQRKERRILGIVKKKRYDFIFAINTEVFSTAFWETVKEHQPSARFLLYIWDSLRRYPRFEHVRKFFDTIFSFDRLDTETNPGLVFLPLFFRESAGFTAGNTEKDAGIVFDISFVGWVHSDRVLLLKRLIQECEEKGIRYYFYLYTGILQYLRFKVNEDRIIHRHIKCRKIPYKKYIEVSKRSKAILDLPHPLQSGLTIRSVEILALGKVLLTTNEDIVHYDVYRQGRTYLLDRNNPALDARMFESADAVPDEFIRNYSIEHWVQRIFLPQEEDLNARK